MPLPNTASLQDVIDKLEELQGMNQKAELASVIGSPAVSTDTVAQQIIKLQTIKDEMAVAITDKGVSTSPNDDLETMKDNIESITTGGSISVATVNSSTVQGSFQYYNGSAAPNQYFIEYSGLDFEPDIITYSYVPSSTIFYTHIYTKGEGSTLSRVTLTQSNATRIDSYNYNIRANAADCYVNSTGFKLPILINTGNALPITFTAIKL